MRLRAICLVAVAAVAAGCGSKSARRHDVDAYIARVDNVVVRYRGAVAVANDAYKHFGTRSGPRQLARLRAAEASILAIRTDLRRTAPPKDARKLHVLLLRLVDRELDVASAATQFSAFIPTARKALAQVAATNARFRGAFHAATTAAEQQTVFATYGDELGGDAAALGDLAPPPALVPWQRAEVRRLQRTAAAAGALSRALAAHDRAAVTRAVAAFTASTSVTDAELRAQRQAIIRYDREVTSVARAAAKVQRERDRLQQLLG